jgi:type I restriction enzyme S subunit
MFLPIPSLDEQERIVGELDCLSGVIEKKKQQLKELDALAQSIFYEMFGNPVENDRGWEVKKIKDIAIVKIGPFGSLLHTSDYVCGGIPLVNPIHMCEEKVCADINFTVSENKIGELQNYILHAGDIVFARRGDIGRCALIRDVDNGYLCGTGSLFVRMVEDVNTVFFIKMMRCGMIIKSLNSLAKGATMLNINCKIIEDFSVILPPIFLQQQFAEKIEKIEKQKELIRKSIEEVEMLFNSRMDYYFG